MFLFLFVVKYGLFFRYLLGILGEVRGCGGIVFLRGEGIISLILGRVDGLVDTVD